MNMLGLCRHAGKMEGLLSGILDFLEGKNSLPKEYWIKQIREELKESVISNVK